MNITKKKQTHRYSEWLPVVGGRSNIVAEEWEVHTTSCKTGSMMYNIGNIANILAHLEPKLKILMSQYQLILNFYKIHAKGYYS